MVSVFLFSSVASFSQKKLLVLGSSTSACWGPSLPANCYINRLSADYAAKGQPIIIDNRAVGGYNVYKSMPRSFKPPQGRDTALAYYSITDALAANPDVILVNYPSNSYDIFSIAEVMNCLRIIKSEANKAGKPCYITSTQPRSAFDAAGREKLRILKDSIIYQFGASAIDFWTDLADPISLGIAAAYQVAGDGVHMNDQAHELLFQRVLAKNIFHALLPDAGQDMNISLPYGGLLDGRNSTSTAGITSYSWTKIAGPSSYNLVSPTSSSSYINSLIPGVYTFRLTVKDASGATATDDVKVSVKEAENAVAPVAQAGPDITIDLPASSVFLDGSKSASAGSSIIKANWSYVSGPSAYNIVTPIAITTTINALVQGVYQFRLTVTNNYGISSSDDVMVTVRTVATAQPPVANAGNDESIPEGQATVLHGENSTAPAGSIKSYLWTKISGPANYEILTPTASSTWIRNMIAGVYVYRLKVTDNNDATAFDDVVITVRAATSTTLPVANAGADQSITEGQSTTLNAEKSTGNIKSFFWSKFSTLR